MIKTLALFTSLLLFLPNNLSILLKYINYRKFKYQIVVFQIFSFLTIPFVKGIFQGNTNYEIIPPLKKGVSAIADGGF